MCLLIFRILRLCICSFVQFTLEILRKAVNEGISVIGCLERKSHSWDRHHMEKQDRMHVCRRQADLQKQNGMRSGGRLLASCSTACAGGRSDKFREE